MPDLHRAVLALGSNLGDREATIRAAIRDLDALADVTVTAASSIVETAAMKPHGIDADAPAYLNAVVLVDTSAGPYELLAAVNGIERAHGRVRDVRWGDRTLDIDIIDMSTAEMDGIRLDTADLVIPHPRAADRAFVLVPWLQVDPDAALPGRGRVDALLAATGDTVTEYPAEPLL